MDEEIVQLRRNTGRDVQGLAMLKPEAEVGSVRAPQLIQAEVVLASF